MSNNLRLILLICSFSCVNEPTHKNPIVAKPSNPLAYHTDTKDTGKNKFLSKVKKKAREKFVPHLFKKARKYLDDHNSTTTKIKKNQEFDITHSYLRVNDLPEDKKLNIVLFSDTHILFSTPEFVETWVKELNNLIRNNDVDLVFFLGDLVNFNLSEIISDSSVESLGNTNAEEKLELLKKIQKEASAKDIPVISIMGNHDYGSYLKKGIKPINQNEVSKMMSIMENELKWIVLDDEYYIYQKDDLKIKIVGISELAYCSSLENTGDVEKALETEYQKKSRQKDLELITEEEELDDEDSVDISEDEEPQNEKTFNILLSHDPDAWPVTQEETNINRKNSKTKKGFPVTFSGHTHGSRITAEYNDIDNPEEMRIRHARTFFNEKHRFKPKPGLCIHKYYNGEYRDDNEDLLYVSPGIGFSGSWSEKKSKKGKDKYDILESRGDIKPAIQLITLIPNILE